MVAIELDGRGLRLEALLPVVRGEPVRLSLAAAAREVAARTRRIVEEKVAAGEVVYGVNTGFGRFARVRIPPEQARALQRNLLLSHASGVGDPLSPEETRLALLLRVQALATSRSGVRPALLDALVEMFNRNVVPVVPEQGSVGASGDLSPLAHLALPLIGEGEAWFGGSLMAGGRALERAGLRPFVLEMKEGLALVNGTQATAAVGVGAALRAREISKAGDAAGSLTLEAVKGSPVPFDERTADARPHPGHAKTARNLRRCLEGSEVVPSHRDCGKVQDAYSLRCMPQVHGAAKDGLAHAWAVLEREANAATDNPLVFDDGTILSGGNFHGAPLAAALDSLAIALATWGGISERRVEHLVNPDLSGLPAFLVREGGLHSGLMMPQVVAASLVSENKVLAHPASVDSIPTGASREDLVPMSLWAARKARAIARNVESILGIELLCAAQAREFSKELRPGRGADAAHAAVRRLVPVLETDRFLAPDLEAVRAALVRGEIVASVESAVGPLEW